MPLRIIVFRSNNDDLKRYKTYADMIAPLPYSNSRMVTEFHVGEKNGNRNLVFSPYPRVFRDMIYVRVVPPLFLAEIFPILCNVRKSKTDR